MSPPHGDAKKPPGPERRWEIAHYLPSQSFLSLLFVAVAAGLLVVWPIATQSGRAILSGGAISNHHRLIEHDCRRCHATPFSGASDTQCAGCHTVGEHAPSMDAVHAADRSTALPCAGCHKEHHGQESLVPTDSPLCTSCHLRLSRLLPETGAPAIADFAHHPEFALRPSKKGSGRQDPVPAGERVRIGDPGAMDHTHIKFSHVEHLAAHKDEKERLACPSCHQIGPDRRTMAPIDYRSRCQRCHELEFDERRAGDHVPHGDPDQAFEHIEAAVGRLLTAAAKAIAALPHPATTSGAYTNGGDGGASVDGGAGGGNLPGNSLTVRVEEESRGDERALFTEHRGCDRCHDVTELPSVVEGRSRFHVIRPDIPVRWMAAARFDHAAHHATPCQHCHANAPSSTSASDLLLPAIAVCRECHADPGTPGKVDSPCLQCHDYHAR